MYFKNLTKFIKLKFRIYLIILKDLKLEKWDKVVDDCNQVFKYDKDNIKALLRRATAYFKKRTYRNAKTDIQKCLSLDPNDKKAKVDTKIRN